jgi:hypothetical protein
MFLCSLGCQGTSYQREVGLTSEETKLEIEKVGPSSTPTKPPVKPSSKPSPKASPEPVSLKHGFTGWGTEFAGTNKDGGACGLLTSDLELPNFVALNFFNMPGNYSQQVSHDQPPEKQGLYKAGSHCGRWVEITLGRYCEQSHGSEDPPCPEAKLKVDDLVGAKAYAIVTDACDDNSRWCRDDPYHLDLNTSMLDQFYLNGRKLSSINSPNRWNNRELKWRFVPVPQYKGDIKIGWGRGSDSQFYQVLAVSRLPNGLSGIEIQQRDGSWKKISRKMTNGNLFVQEGSTLGPAPYRCRVFDADGEPLFGGRIYQFSFPCSGKCQPVVTWVSYSTEDPTN